MKRSLVFDLVTAPVWFPIFVAAFCLAWASRLAEAMADELTQILDRGADFSESLDEPREGRQ